jgi:hypothetical protein
VPSQLNRKEIKKKDQNSEKKILFRFKWVLGISMFMLRVVRGHCIAFQSVVGMYIYMVGGLNSLTLGLFSATFTALDRPWEMCDGDDEEGVAVKRVVSLCLFEFGDERRKKRRKTYLSSAIPARALYHAMKAANNPKYPPALIVFGWGTPASLARRWPIPKRRKARSKKKKSRKKATVDRSVQINRIVVKMNHPIRKKPKALLKSLTPAPVASYDDTISNPPGVRTTANESQKPPYDDRAVAPKVFPTAISLGSC